MQVQPSQKFCTVALERHAMCKHLAAKMRPERFYAIPVAAASLDRYPTASTKKPDDGGLEIDAPAQPRALESEKIAYVKFVAKNLTRQRLGPVPAAATTAFHTQDICVARHDTWRVTSSSGSGLAEEATPAARTVVQVEPRSWHKLQDHLSVLSLCQADIQALREGMLAWSARTELHCRLMGFPAALSEGCHECLRLLVLNNAFPECFAETESVDGVRLTDSQHELLAGMELLQSGGYVEALSSGACLVWRFLGGSPWVCEPLTLGWGPLGVLANPGKC